LKHAGRSLSSSDHRLLRRDGAAVHAGAGMIVLAILAGGILVYLVIALLQPEKF
jgi:K+-transporting ATPase KdpF subunit